MMYCECASLLPVGAAVVQAELRSGQLKIEICVEMWRKACNVWSELS